MPNIRSAKKALRQSLKRAVKNRSKREAINAIAKKIKRLALDGQKAEATKLLAQAYKLADKAAKLNTIHKGKAARFKSRLAKAVK